MQLPSTSETSLQQIADQLAANRGNFVVQQPSFKGMSLGRGIYELLLKVSSFEEQLAAIKIDLSSLGDRLGQFKPQADLPESIAISPPHPAAFLWLRILNSLEDLTLDESPDRHAEEFKKLHNALEEKCFSFLTEKQNDWQRDLTALCQPFTTESNSEASLQERAQRYQQIEQMRLKVLNFDWNTQPSSPIHPAEFHLD